MHGRSGAVFRHAVFGVAVAAAAGCAEAQRPQATSAGEGERLMRMLVEEGLNRKDSTVLNRTVAAEFTLHARGQSVTLSRPQFWALTRPILTGFPDVHFSVEEVITDGARVAARIRFTGTHRGAWGGIAPTGRQVRVSEMFMCRVADGLLAECWQEWDEHGLREQLGAGQVRPNGG